MSEHLDLNDIQGNIVKAYGRYGYPMARYFFFRIRRSVGAREFVKRMTALVTTASNNDLPSITTNIAFTYQGLKRLGVPKNTLHGLPDEFCMGMKDRRTIVGDIGPNYFTNWDPIWNGNNEQGINKYDQLTHIFISINGRYDQPADPNDSSQIKAALEQTEANLEKHYRDILAVADAVKIDGQDSVELLTGHISSAGNHEPYQRGVAMPDGKEHFGYSDGISSTFFKGSGDDPDRVIGGGKPNGKDPSNMDGWDPIETGEFLLGYKDEAHEYPKAAGPPLFSRNGTFMVYRKLHQNVASFNNYLNKMGKMYPDGKEAFAAKIAGRWRNGAPIVNFPTEDEANRFKQNLDVLAVKVHRDQASKEEIAEYRKLKIKLRNFDYTDDNEGAQCPFGAHLRRANPRSALMFNVKDAFDHPSALSNRRRLLRRGLPYGYHDSENPSDDGDHGIIIMLLNTSIRRQYEFVQQQWFNYGNDFKLANDQDPIMGNNGENKNGQGSGRMMIEGENGRPPFFCSAMPTMVETRGGDYYFVPSITCLHMIANGSIDAT